MKNKNYEAPLCEVIEIEIEDAVLNPSTEGEPLPGFGNGGDA